MIDATPLLRLYARLRRSRLTHEDQANIQEQQLSRLIRYASQTKFGSDHAFGSIKSVDDFQKRVPLRTYEMFWDEYWRPHFPHLNDITWPGQIPFYAVSSGTTSGKTKYIPYTREMQRSNTKAGLDLLVHHISAKPSSRIAGGKSFILGGSTELVEEAAGIFSGDLSGISVKTLPWWARPYYFPSSDLALLKDWEEKIEKLTTYSLKTDIRMLSGVPSWLLIFIKRLSELRPESAGKLAALYPNLEMLVHGGVNFAPYHRQFTEILEGSDAELREVYPASEGFIAVADRGYGDGMRVMCDSGIFYEFVPLDELQSKNPTRHWIKTIEPEVNYAIVLTTCAGLWSYILGDTVKFIETSPPRLLVTGRTSYFLSAFGEHLTGEELEASVSRAAQTINASVTDYSVGALYPSKPGDLGGHLFVVEFAASGPASEDLKKFAAQLKDTLCELNDDYAAHLADGFGLRLPDVCSAKPGMFAAWMKSRGKLGGQHKVPRIITDQKLFDGLVAFEKSYGER